MRLFLYLVFFVIAVLSAGCSIRSVKKGEYVSVPEERYVHYFSVDSSTVFFRTALQVMNDHHSGLLAVKPVEAGKYRCVFTTQTGFKVFDYTLTDSRYTINYGVSMLSKDMVAKRMSFTIWAALLRKIESRGMYRYKGDNRTYLTFLTEKMAYEIIKPSGDSLGLVTGQNVYAGKRKRAEAHFYAHSSQLVPDSCAVNLVGFPLKASFVRIIR